MTNLIEILFGFLVSHAVCDIALQSVSLSQNKRKSNTAAWLYYLWGHGLMHGGGVYIVTNNVYLGLAEAVAHTLIDYLKCEGKFGMLVDQGLHMLCKLIWLGVIWLGVICLSY